MLTNTLSYMMLHLHRKTGPGHCLCCIVFGAATSPRCDLIKTYVKRMYLYNKYPDVYHNPVNLSQNLKRRYTKLIIA